MSLPVVDGLADGFAEAAHAVEHLGAACASDLRRSDDDVRGHLLEVVASRRVEAEQLRDHADGERVCELGRQVAVPAPGELLEQLVCELLDPWLERGDPSWCESAVHHVALLRVNGRVLGDE